MSSLLKPVGSRRFQSRNAKADKRTKAVRFCSFFLRPFRHIIHYFQCHNIIGRRQLIVAAFNVIMAN